MVASSYPCISSPLGLLIRWWLPLQTFLGLFQRLQIFLLLLRWCIFSIGSLPGHPDPWLLVVMVHLLVQTGLCGKDRFGMFRPISIMFQEGNYVFFIDISLLPSSSSSCTATGELDALDQLAQNCHFLGVGVVTLEEIGKCLFFLFVPSKQYGRLIY